ncbi:hypothetical protein [Proteiniborus sp.]
MTLWNLAETAGVKPRYMKKVQEKIKEALVDEGYDANFLTF